MRTYYIFQHFLGNQTGQSMTKPCTHSIVKLERRREEVTVRAVPSKTCARAQIQLRKCRTHASSQVTSLK